VAGTRLVKGERLPMFWTVSTTVMTEEQASRASELIETEFPGVQADPVDPAGWFSLHLDRWTTELVRDALVSLHRAGGDVGGLLDTVEDWLENQADPYPEDAEPSDIYAPINT
jgi:hypothetical protein